MQARIELDALPNCQIPVSTFDHKGNPAPPVMLNTTRSYKHLGSVTSAVPTLNPVLEINARITDAKRAYHSLRKRVFATSLPTKTKMLALESLVLSRLFHNSGTWSQLTPKLHQKLDHTLAYFLKPIVGLSYRPNVDVASTCRVLSTA